MTALCVVDHEGAIRWRGSCPGDAALLAETIRLRVPGLVRIGLETAQMSNWLTLSLRGREIVATAERTITRPAWSQAVLS